MKKEEISVGIDVSKERLDIAVAPRGERWEAANDDAGVQIVAARLRTLAPAFIIMEATGGYEAVLAGCLAGAGLPVCVVNPAQVRSLLETGEMFCARLTTQHSCSVALWFTLPWRSPRLGGSIFRINLPFIPSLFAKIRTGRGFFVETNAAL